MKFVNLLLILFFTTLTSGEKDELKLAKENKFELPSVVKKYGSDSLKVGFKPKLKKKNKKFFLKKT